MRIHRHLAVADHHEPARVGIEDRQERCGPERLTTRQRRENCRIGPHPFERGDIEVDDHSLLAPEWLAIVGTTEDPHQIRIAHSHIVTLTSAW